MQQSPAVTKLIDEGLAAHGAGDIVGAREKFQAALKIDPHEPEALHLLGLMCELEKDRDQAVSYLRQAVEIDPDEPLFRMNLASVLEKLRRFDEALEHVDAALKMKPGASDIWCLRGDIAFTKNDADAASAAYRKAFERNPENISALAGYGRAMLLKGEKGEASRALQAALKADPTNTKALTLAIESAQGQQNHRAVRQLMDQWKAAHANDAESLKDLANLLFRIGYWEGAQDVFSKVIEIGPETAETLITYGRMCSSARKFDIAEEVLTKALAMQPDSAAGLFAMSRLKFFLGDIELAQDLCRRSLEANINNPAALLQLCDLTKGDLEDKYTDAMIRLASEQTTSPNDAYKILVELGRVHDRRNKVEEAFESISKGKAVGEKLSQKADGGFNAEKSRQYTDRLISLFNARIEPRSFSAPPATPIFVIGAPRSGTTLMESVLACHPDVIGVGEPSSLPFVLSDVLSWADRTGAQSIKDASAVQLQTWRDLYFTHTPAEEGAAYIVDKQTMNFKGVGLIQALFPDAKILHIRRNPVETGFSIFRHAFNEGWSFTYKLEDIAFFYGEYARLIKHWENLLADAFPLFQYEKLIADFENETKRLYSHCGLDWRENVLEFHSQKRPVMTFSTAQVREPLKTKPDNAGERYSEFLAPLRDGLVAANVNLKTGALIE